MPQYDVDLRDYWRIIKKRKTIIIAMVVLIGICSYGFAKLKEPAPVYEATCAIKIEEQTNLAALLTGSYWYPGESIITHAHIITSFPVLTATAKELGWLSPDLKADQVKQSQSAMSIIQRLKEMILPDLLAIIVPLLVGFVMGKEALGGFLAGATTCGVLMGIMMANGGASWDNAKKWIEEGNLGGKGTPTHAASVVGDTVGDPFKDTAGTSMNILIKLMAIVSLVFIPLFLK